MRLETKRLILREFTDYDWEAVFDYQTNPLYMRYYPFNSRTVKEVKDFVQGFLNQKLQQPRIKIQLAVTLKSTGNLIGNYGIRMDAPDTQIGDLGFELSPDHWGQGYSAEAAREIVTF